MIEIRDGKKVLITPVSAEDLADIHIGDIVWLDGDLMTCRDVAHRRLIEYGRELPYDIRDKAIFHAGPIVRKVEGSEDSYEMVSVGPTTSMRMEKFEYEFVKHTGVRVIVGKGGMGPNTERACKEFGAIHCVFPAGCAVVAATEVLKIQEHHWDELGMPETLWCSKVREFGPLIVSIDAEGRNLFEEQKIIYNEKKEAVKAIMAKLPLADLNLAPFKPEALNEMFNSPKWAKLSEACLGCGTCTFVCPTCQCYDIRDYDTGHGIQRFRCWDSCMYSDFTMMAHGTNRPTQLERFRQRFMHKLVYFPSNNDGMYSCVGCGRCVSKCPISMNIAKVIKALGEDKDE